MRTETELTASTATASDPTPNVASHELLLRQFIDDTFMLGRKARDLADEDSLLDNGVIDSTGVLELIAFIEETFDLELADDEIVPENLDSIARISSFVRSKQQ